jgi:hypothetical protein
MILSQKVAPSKKIVPSKKNLLLEMLLYALKNVFCCVFAAIYKNDKLNHYKYQKL